MIDMKINDQGRVTITYIYKKDPETADLRVIVKMFNKDSFRILDQKLQFDNKAKRDIYRILYEQK